MLSADSWNVHTQPNFTSLVKSTSHLAEAYVEAFLEIAVTCARATTASSFHVSIAYVEAFLEIAVTCARATTASFFSCVDTSSTIGWRCVIPRSLAVERCVSFCIPGSMVSQLNLKKSPTIPF